MNDDKMREIKGYEIREKIGEGGFGAVYRAFQPVIEREVAIKVILPEYANKPDFIRNFEVEARLVARLEHPHIVPLFDYWRDPEGAYLVMRWLRGGSLRSRLETGGKFTLNDAAKFLDQVCGALSVAHRNGVVHRDIKPDNILLDEDGNAYLSDFGIALQLGQEETVEDEESITGSIHYMSPEQLQSRVPAPSFDIYSMGILLYEALSGLHPWHGNTPSQMIVQHLNEPVPLISEEQPDFPAGIDAVIQRSTAKDPEERYETVSELAKAFRDTLTGQATIELPAIDFGAGDLINPYKGLRAFDEADSADFFGRDFLIHQLIYRMEDSRFLAVVGPSGSGKSSVVKAGLVPALRDGGLAGADDWYITDFTPGDNPIAALGSALLRIAPAVSDQLLAHLFEDDNGLLWAAENLAPGDSDLLIVIDQFEEVFTLLDDEAQRLRFMNLIQTAVSAENSRVRVVVTLRADFYDRPLYYEGFGSLIQEHTQVVLPMTAAEIESAITGPAERSGLQVDTDLVAAIIADVQEEPGALPLLQYALTECFERREGFRLTLGGYYESGGVLGALARRAEEVYTEFDDGTRTAAKQMFLRLVSLGEGTEDTRRRVRRAELSSLVEERDHAERVLQAFGQYRLLTFDTEPSTREPVVEVAHEAIIREWGSLREWLNESRNDVRLQRMLSAAATEWRRGEQDKSYLLRGARLAQFEEWAVNTDIAFTSDERGYLDASISDAARVRQQQRRLRFIAAAIGLTVIAVLTILSVFAFNQSSIARDEADENATAQAQAQVARETSDANAVIAATSASVANASADEARTLLIASAAQQALDIDNSTLGLALALEAYDIGAAPDLTRQVLAQAAYAPGAREERVLIEEGETRGVAFSPERRILVVSRH